MQFHDVELAAEARREVAARIAIYDKWVIEGALDAGACGTADRDDAGDCGAVGDGGADAPIRRRAHGGKNPMKSMGSAAIAGSFEWGYFRKFR